MKKRLKSNLYGGTKFQVMENRRTDEELLKLFNIKDCCITLSRISVTSLKSGNGEPIAIKRPSKTKANVNHHSGGAETVHEVLNPSKKFKPNTRSNSKQNAIVCQPIVGNEEAEKVTNISNPPKSSMPNRTEKSTESKASSKPKASFKPKASSKSTALVRRPTPKSCDTVDLGEVVLVKIRGWCDWPAVVDAINGKSIGVTFFGDNTTYKTNIRNVFKFHASFETIKSNLERLKNPLFKKAISEAEIVLGVPSASSILNR